MITKIIYLEGDDGVSPFEEFDDLQKFGHVTAADIFSAHLVITDAGRILKDSRDHKTIVNSLELVKKKKGRSKYRSIYGDEEIKPIKFLEEPGQPNFDCAQHGEHTDEILAELGYSADQIAALRAEKAV